MVSSSQQTSQHRERQQGVAGGDEVVEHLPEAPLKHVWSAQRTGLWFDDVEEAEQRDRDRPPQQPGGREQQSTSQIATISSPDDAAMSAPQRLFGAPTAKHAGDERRS